MNHDDYDDSGGGGHFFPMILDLKTGGGKHNLSG